MKALFLKDLYMLQSMMKQMLVMVVFYIVVLVTTGATDALSFVLILFAVTFTFSTLSLDEALKWDRYALSGPPTRRDVVCAKYALALALLAAALLISLLSYALLGLAMPSRPLAEMLLMMGAELCLGLLALAVILPAIYKYGAEKGRMLLVAVLMIPILAAVLYSKYAPPGLRQLVQAYTHFLPVALALVTVGGVYLSYRISLRIYTNKDF